MSGPTFRERILAPGADITVVELVPWHGSALDADGRAALDLAAAMAAHPAVDAVSVTDNAGGHAMAGPEILAREAAANGAQAIVHVACRDRNRNDLLSLGWRLLSEDIDTILCLSGDYPVEDVAGVARPVFDMDSVALLELYRRAGVLPSDDGSGGLFPGVAVNNYKRLEAEVMPQLFKLELKVRTGARYVIGQVGWDARKQDELLRYMRLRKLGVPVLNNVFRLTRGIARAFHAGRIPGVTVSDALFEQTEEAGGSPDKGKAFFRELAARQIAIGRGLGHAGTYLGGVHKVEEMDAILELAASYGPDDWKDFARDLQYPLPGTFYYFEQDPDTCLNSETVDRIYRRSSTAAARRWARRRVDPPYLVNRFVHDVAFEPGTPGFRLFGAAYGRVEQVGLARPLHIAEQAIKIPLFDCRDCGDCSLPEIAYLCPESQCAKNQRNGPCGGTRDGECEVPGRRCIWVRAYGRLKPFGEERATLERPVVITDHALRRTSAWANTYLGRDHAGRARTSGGDHAPKP